MLKKILIAFALLLAAAHLPRPLLAADSPSEARSAREQSSPRGELLPAPVEQEDALTLIWTLAIFIVLVMLLYWKAWGPVLNGLKAREQRIRNDIAEAENARLKGEQTLKQYNQQLAAAEERVRELIANATADGERMAAQIRTHAQQEAEETKERAIREIEGARNQALAEIYQQAAALATDVAEKILRRNLNPDDQRDLVNQSLEQFEKIGRN